jgi:hypothetical protein
MTEHKTWGAVGRELAQKLKGVTDEAAIKALGDATRQDILNREPTAEGRANALRMVSREIMKQYPRLSAEAPAYWYDPKGRESQSKWRHLIFKSLSLSTTDWDTVGGEARQEWKATQPTEHPTEQATEQPADQLTKQATTTLNDMTIEQLELDADTQQILKNALEQSGMPLPDFIRQAIKVYAKTITGKSKKQSEDLSTVPTDKLLADSTYSTHPGRAEELTKRAIKAIKYYNANIATEQADRWCITQSAIASLTGSRASTIGKVLEQFKDDIESHNQSYELDNYSNRKRGKPSIEQTINLTELTPDGLD